MNMIRSFLCLLLLLFPLGTLCEQPKQQGERSETHRVLLCDRLEW